MPRPATSATCARDVQHGLWSASRLRPLLRGSGRADVATPVAIAAASGGWGSPPVSLSATAATSTMHWPFACRRDRSMSTEKGILSSGRRSAFAPGRTPLVVNTPWGRVGLAVCADMMDRRVWDDYRGRIDLAVIASAWPEFACRHSGRRHCLFGHVGPMAVTIPTEVARDLDVPVIFANQTGSTPHDDPGARPDAGHAHRRPVRRSQQHL